MAEDRLDQEPGRSAQTLEPAPDRRGKTRAGEREAEDASPGVSVVRGDIPEALKRRYFSEDGRIVTSFFAGPGAKVEAFRDHGGKLSTHQVDPATIRDMVAVAAHRGWRTLQVRGDDDFRREVWMEARAAGLQVRGYRPRQRDEQELEARLGAEAARARRGARDRTSGDDGGRAPARAGAAPDYDAGVRGVLLETGEAPYRRREGQPLTPYVRLDRGDGGVLDIWGVGLTDALARSGVRTGDQVLVRRDGVDRVQKTLAVRDPDTGETKRQTREVPRNRWTILAERFREASPAEAARDPELRDAQGQLAVVKTVIQASLQDPDCRARVYAAAREQVASRLDQGRHFRPARVEETARVTERTGPEPGRRPEPTSPEPEPGPERMRRR